MKIAIVDYNAGNVRSVAFALERMGIDAEITADHDKIRKADKVIFPGVGEASSAMKTLISTGLDKLLPSLTQPFLGICFGMQLMCAHSEEGNVDCLNIVDNQVCRFPPKDKVPHIGWNSISKLKGPLFKDVPDGSFVYFVHSYFVEEKNNSMASSHYIHSFCASIQHKNFYAVQFHPEKSGEVGAQILKNFVEL